MCLLFGVSVIIAHTHVRVKHYRPYRNFVDCIRKVAATEGPMAFYSGYGTFVVR